MAKASRRLGWIRGVRSPSQCLRGNDDAHPTQMPAPAPV